MIEQTQPKERLRRAATPDSSATTTYLGPATVLAPAKAGPQVLQVELADDNNRQVSVTPAFTFPYEASAGDTLLVLGQGNNYYAVGVIAGSRPKSLMFPGDAHVGTIAGKLTLASDQAVELRAPKVTVRTGLLRTVAANVVEKADNFRRWVRNVLAIRAGESRRLVDGEDSTRCENSTTLAKDTVKIDGDQLHLGH